MKTCSRMSFSVLWFCDCSDSGSENLRLRIVFSPTHGSHPPLAFKASYPSSFILRREDRAII
ncbi:hypothetical protein DsansV1_C04g0037501 [Dioscorea sansibarensis]